ncbi:alpha/beta hydrolase family protein [Paenibacillus hodogayensis]|uniref:Alpha/beta hydrolase family protein n=1 Tax=Paenibacillus hodogayensis TaxID=279208 RepID=A0ABV5VQ16_9BACL
MNKPFLSPWNMEQLHRSPRIYPSDVNAASGIHSIFYEGLPFQGKATRIFAHYGLPEAAVHEKVPAIVLVHGGGGTAYEEWVSLWTSRGYAAIAMDLEGHIPDKSEGTTKRLVHTMPGPSREGIFVDCDEPVEEQWMYHAAANVMLAHSLLRSMPSVDPQRIGITGISWGGIVASLVAGIDNRFAFGIPVYGCGFLYEAHNEWGQRFVDMGEASAESVKRLTEPSAYLSRVTMPMLWVNWLCDPHFGMNIFSKSYTLAKNGIEQSGLCIYPRLGHSHPLGWKPDEIYAFADSIVRGGKPLLRLGEPSEKDGAAFVDYSSAEGNEPLHAELYYTANCDNWQLCEWATADCTLNRSDNRVSIRLPQDAKAFFINVRDSRGHTSSTPVIVRSPRLHADSGTL